MGVFKTADEVYDSIGALFNEVKDKDVAERIGASNLVIQFKYTDPESVITIDCKNEAEGDNHLTVISGDCDLKADVTLSMKADLAHKFWFGKVNLLTALTTRKIVAKGPIPKILKLLPAIQPLYKMYPEMLKKWGKDALVIY
jgi:putative sterol carrier protein